MGERGRSPRAKVGAAFRVTSRAFPPKAGMSVQGLGFRSKT